MGTEKRLFCNRCRNTTRHTCIGEHYYNPALDEINEEKVKIYLIDAALTWACNGCEDVLLENWVGALQEIHLNGDVFISDEGVFEIEWNPPRTENSFAAKNYLKLPDKVANVYDETILAHNRGLYLLSAIGVRTLIEAICVDKSITGKSLQDRIDGLKQILPVNIVDNLHALRFMGNEAIHEIEEPKEDELHLAIEICEDLLNILYELDYKTTRLNNERALRKASANKR